MMTRATTLLFGLGIVLGGCATGHSAGGEAEEGSRSAFTLACASEQECLDAAALWSCQELINIEAYERACTRTPDGGEGWTCLEGADGRVLCTNPAIDLEPGAGWTCAVEEFRGTVCTTEQPLRGEKPGLLPPGTGSWRCAVEEFGVVCEQDGGAGQGPGVPGETVPEVPGEGGKLPPTSSGQVPRPGEFRSQTPGGWGAPASGNNPGAYRDAHFDAAFPDGLTIGCVEGHQATFTSAKAIETFLPYGGSPGILERDFVDPSDATSAGVFAGHLVAATLAAGFDGYDEAFGTSDTSLGDLVAKEGACQGMTVKQILAAANAVIGGCDSTRSPEQLKSCVAAINENFVDGRRAGNYLVFP